MFEFCPLLTASSLKFDEIEKQSMYETISFKEVQKEIVVLKVLSLFIGSVNSISSLLLEM